MVTSHKMIENEMGYRGSKSELNSVKEQRVDGSWSIKAISNKKMLLRCTLMGFERNYPVKISSKQLNKSFSTVSAIAESGVKTLNPWFVSGFADAESSFSTSIYKNNKLTTGYRVKSSFSIGLNQRDSFILYQVQEFFGGIGTIRLDKTANAVKYSVDNLKDLRNIIIPHFKKYPLITQKAADFILFEQIVELMHEGAHITIDGLQQIINIKASMNLGISETIKSEFNQTKPVKRTIIQTTNIPNPNWITGFVSGEGNFDAGIRKSTNIVGSRVYLRFRLTQHTRDTQLMELIIKYLGVGRLEKDSRNRVVTIVVGNFSNLTEIIIPFFNQYPILGVKHLDYQDWCKIANLISQGSHLTIEGFEEIRVIEARINQGRKNKKII
ncbi:hypothetical protein POSPLADRAFT_1160921 [Postia placenta MAD-698-R-SB12]|uniref:Homing endonuclease LAGLIDADG domain-containing protein n=1 Tax=Postia placenta MAD-698-R-SB12 TaxID=670580 RepID=A0A1X6MIG2_9APHY|nr:hypothetical protein POSPLADRAFT_1160921 [Postia placenta MAD-698-R-SB12]OSX56128.1 hypothetical protein POSPLADRAFT_1160921 [Postia placenta MAD-698-R-SB12]